MRVNIDDLETSTSAPTATSSPSMATERLKLLDSSITINENTDSTSYLINGECEGIVGPIALRGTSLTLDTTANCNTNQTFQMNLDTSQLPEGEISLWAEASNLSGNRVQSPLCTLIRDVTPPTLSISTPTIQFLRNYANRNSDIIINGVCSELGPINIILDSGPPLFFAICDGSTFNGVISDLAWFEGLHNLKFASTDPAGNVKMTAPIIFNKDINPPTVGITNPTDLSLNSGTLMQISGNCSELNDNVTIEIKKGVSPLEILNANCNAGSYNSYLDTSNLLPADVIKIRALHIDSIGNQSETPIITVTQSGLWNPSFHIGSLYAPAVPSSTVDLILLAPSAFTEMYITNTPNCLSDGVWEPYLPLKSNWTLSPDSSGTAFVYLKFKTASNEYSACISKSIQVAKSAPTSFDACSTASSTEVSGLFFDDGGPSGNYGVNQNCDFTINYSGPIQLHFNIFDFDAWSFDYLRSWKDSNLGRPLGAFNDNAVPSDIVVDHGPIAFNMSSDEYSSNNVGYSLSWSPALGASAIKINDGERSVSSATVQLKITTNDSNLREMYITENPSCNNDGTWVTTATMQNWNFTSTDGSHSVYIKFRDPDQHETPCESASVNLFLSPIVATLSYLPNLTDTYTYIEVGGTGIDYYRYKFGLASTTNCSDPLGYSNLFPAASSAINENLLSLPDGLFKVCVVGGVGPDLFQSFATPTEFQWTKIQPVGFEFRKSGQTLMEGDQNVTFTISSSKPLAQDTIIEYELFGDLAEEQNLSGGTLTLLTGGTLFDFQVYIQNNMNASTDKSLVAGITRVPNPHKVGPQGLSNVLIRDSQRGSSSTVLDISDNGYCIITSPGVIKCATYVGGGSAGNSTFFDTYVTHGTLTQFKKFVYSQSYGGHHCVLDIADQLYCWGWGFDGNIGDGAKTDRRYPTLVSGGLTWKQVSGSLDWNVVCGIDSLDDLYCWGDQTFSHGAVGNGTTTDAAVPTLIDPSTKYKKVETTGNNTCGIAVTGELKCWGRANLLATVGTIDQYSPLLMDSGTSYKDINIGSYICGVTDSGAIKCWGAPTSDLNFWTGVGSIMIPTLVDNSHNYQKVLTLGKWGCGITVDGEVWCFGFDNYKAFTSNYYTQIPLPVDPGVQYQKLVKNSSGLCGLLADGTLKCWGANSSGWAYSTNTLYSTNNYLTPTLADSDKFASFTGNCGITINGVPKCLMTAPQRSSPYAGSTTTFYPFGSSLKWKHLFKSCGVDIHDRLYQFNSEGTVILKESSGAFKKYLTCGGFYCGILQDNHLACFGSASGGMIGDGSTTSFSSETPVIIDSGETYIDASYNSNFICGITTSNHLKCWGANNSYGQLGTNDLVTYRVPTWIDTGELYQSVKTGSNAACALTLSGQVKCWGAPFFGTSANVLVPTLVSGAHTFKSIDLNANSVCGIRSDDRVLCWGRNWSGHLGVGDYSNRTDPTLITDTTTYKFVAAPNSSFSNGTCGITTTGNTKCWGGIYWWANLANSTAMISSPFEELIPISTSSWIGLKSDGTIEWQGSNYGVPGAIRKTKFFEPIQGALDR